MPYEVYQTDIQYILPINDRIKMVKFLNPDRDIKYISPESRK